MERANIVILDGYTANPGDLSWEPIEQLGSVAVYDHTTDEQLAERAADATILVVNKRLLRASHLAQLPNVRCICTLATGYNNIDLKAARDRQIVVCNAVGYSTPSVAQHVFAMLLELTNRTGLHSADVQNGGWTRADIWCYWKSPLEELAGKTLGIYGYGRIGQAVGTIGLAFGMRVLAHRRSHRPPTDERVRLVDEATLLSESDVLTLHAPLTVDNQHFINARRLGQMKSTAILINTGRGGLVNEADLRDALQSGTIRAALLDVLSAEPPPADHPLVGLDNCFVTPHQAWATRESRARLIQIVADNIAAFLDGTPRNVVG